MTENKQFTLHIKFYNQEKTLGEATLKEMGQPLCQIESIEDARYIRDTLNELYDENQELQSRIKDYDNALKRLQDLTERKLEENGELKKALLFYLDIAISESSSDFQKDLNKECNILFNCNYEEAKRKYGDFEYKERWESE